MQTKKQNTNKTPSKKEIHKIALNLGVKTGHHVNVAKPILRYRNKTKDELIRDIQKAEDNIVCFKTDTLCNNSTCLWYSECQK